MTKVKRGRTWFWRLGFVLGWLLRVYTRVENKLHGWLKRKNLNVIVCQTVLWGIRLTCLVAFCYVSYWVSVAAVVFWFVRASLLYVPVVEVRTNDDGWRYGHEGFGYYCGAYRIDGGAHDDNG
ncbi:DUF3742 family protein [Pseudomonas sp. LJDD11]|uniref:DUF3742 family protein n=1 Tax=Pseudomonas sp. LJDD11 TaxID=2931984 RepID=UPI00359C199C